jgi:hypothetical protein
MLRPTVQETTTVDLAELMAEYEQARDYTLGLIAELDDGAIRWRPREQASGIGWHLGHQGAVNHFMIRNLTAAEPSVDPTLDALFDSATPEPCRGQLPPVAEILDYRDTIAARTRAIIERIATGDVRAPAQLTIVATTLLVSLINHEYQHDCWIGEVRATLGCSASPDPMSTRLTTIDGYLILDPRDDRSRDSR